MAYLDDNNTYTSGSGKDPLDELDKELAELKLTLGELDDSEPTTSVPTEEPAHAVPTPAPTAPIYKPAPAPATVAQPEIGPEPDYEAEEKHSKPIGGIIIAIVLGTVVLAAVAYFIFLSPWGIQLFANTEPTEPATVTVNDSELGTITLDVVDGADVNTYDPAGLTKDDSGLYAYYVNGIKVSEAGVDLSEYQTDIDFTAVKNAGIDFVMLRIGGRYYSEEGGMYSDNAFKNYYQQAKAAGLKVGCYFFSQAASVADAKEEAQYTLQLLDGLQLDYPVAFDWETIEDDSARTDDVTGEELTEIAKAFCDTISAAGYRPMVYASTSLILQSYDFNTMKDYTFWLADYREFPDSERMYYNFTMWQYTTDGQIPGINAAVDLNLCLKP